MRSLTDRLWAKVDRSAGPDACWPFIGSRDPRGYGRLSTRRGESPVKAHRVAYVSGVGPIPEGMNVLHHCDNPPCCNPTHLFTGTQRVNIRDAALKGRIGTNEHSLANLQPGAPGWHGAGPRR